jgi:hypothetical protein
LQVRQASTIGSECGSFWVCQLVSPLGRRAMPEAYWHRARIVTGWLRCRRPSQTPVRSRPDATLCPDVATPQAARG